MDENAVDERSGGPQDLPRLTPASAASETPRPKVSVIVPSYNSRKTIAACLDSLASQTIAAEIEVIVVDSSRDGSEEFIRASYPSVSLIHRTGLLLPGAARNLGVELARGPIIAFIDADCVAPEGWLVALIGTLRPDRQLVGGSVGLLDPVNLIEVADYILTFNEFSPRTPARDVISLPGANLACMRAFFTEIGGFPGALASGEDMVFTSRSSERTSIAFNPSAVVYHKNRGTLRSFLAHHHRFGIYSATIRLSERLPGSVLARRPWLSPAAPILRAARIALRAIARDRQLLRQAIGVLPLVVMGIAAWGVGFVRASFLRSRASPVPPSASDPPSTVIPDGGS